MSRLARSRWPVLLAAGLALLFGLDGMAGQHQASFGVNITLNSATATTSCSTQSVSGGAVAVQCFTTAVATVSAVTSSSLGETAAQAPSTVNLDNLGPTAAGDSPSSDGSEDESYGEASDTRERKSALIRAPAGRPAPEEIEIMF